MAHQTVSKPDIDQLCRMIQRIMNGDDEALKATAELTIKGWGAMLESSESQS